ncbi:unnamed protein product, partial [marine sediment metagenome]
VGKEMTTQEAMLELGKSMKAINTRLDKMEEQPKPEPQPLPEQPTPAAANEIQQPKQEVLKFTVYDETIKTKRHIIDNSDPEKPIVYDIETAMAKILNELVYLRKALG